MDQRTASPKTYRKSHLTLLIMWLSFLALLYLLIAYVANQEVARQTVQWEQRLQIVSASQARGVSAWIAQRRESLTNLAENVSLRLYLSELSLPNPKETPDEPAELTFLRNLVFSTAANNGFGTLEEPAIRANIPITPGAGMQLVGPNGSQIVSTRTMPAATLLPPALTQSPEKQAFAGPFALGGETLAVAFRQPIFSVQANPGEGAPIGQLMAVTQLDDKFFHLLEPPISGTERSLSMLVKSEGNTLTSYAQKANGLPQASDAAHDATLRAAVAAPARMVQEHDASGRPAFALAEPVEGVPNWWLVRQVDRNEALAEAIQRSRWWRISFLLAAGLLTAVGIAMLRHQSALRSKEAARYYRQLAQRIEQQEQMLTLIAETTPLSTYIIDRENRFRYVNRKAAEDFHMDRADIEGKSLSSVVGAARAEEITKANRLALEQHGSHRSVEEEKADGMPIRSLVREHIPLAAIPIGAAEERTPGVLILETDVTSLVQSRERERKTLSHLIRTLVSLVDKRDPHSAHHSASVSLVAGGIAETMQLADPLPETARIAGQLINLGKISVPEALLTSTTLNAPEKVQIREAMQASADLLHGVPFQGPVTETIRQSQEAPDGSGPLGLKGDDILVTARIVAVANAFVALISSRAWRKGLTVDDALKQMVDGIGSRFDRGAVAALVTYVESTGADTIRSVSLGEAA